MDLLDKVYGDWKVISHDKDRNWNCECTTCGATKSIHEYSLVHRTPKCTHTIKNNDMIGKHFGEWEVVGVTSSTKLRCRCSCGKEKDVNKYTLLDQRSTNCGHMKNKDRVVDLTGPQFRDLKVKRYLGEQYWECECSCGKLCKKHRNHLLDGRAKDCGHGRKTVNTLIDIKNKRFGLLIVKEYKGNNYWLCQCDCGNTLLETGPNLRHKGIVSCGCIVRHISKEEIEQFSNEFRKVNKRLPYRSEMADHFDIGIRQMYYFINTNDASEYVSTEYRSKQEKEIYSLLEGEHIEVGNRRIVKPYELDMYLPEKKIAIEFNGNYWHSENMKDTQYHQYKTFECAKKGVRLIHIFEYEWENDDTKRKIIDMLRNKIQSAYTINKVELQIIEVNQNESKAFLEKYNIYGYIESDIVLGCKYNKELVGVISIKYLGNRDYEIVRLCFKPTINVEYGLRELLTHFINIYKPKNIRVSIDISKFTGNTYSRLGFKVQEITAPNYIWYNCKSHKCVRYTADNEYNIRNSGYTRIYDSGNLELLWEANKCSLEANLQ